jgi:hypothetical protein
VDPVEAIAQAVLYEGYVLWPYRRSALKNQHRFTIGGLYPREYARRFSDRSEAAFDVLVEGKSPQLLLEVRFLQMVRRQVLYEGVAVDEATARGRRYLTWDETVERNLREGRFTYEAGSDEEACSDGVSLMRSWDRVDGRVERIATPLKASLQRISVRIVNESPAQPQSREKALRASLLAAHAVLRVREGAFISPVDPPRELISAAAECRTEGLWPVIVGVAPARDTLLASPIILEEYPQIAPETPCDFFDGAEIGELLARSILSLTDAEKDEVRAGDSRARDILERVEAMSSSELARLHGSIRQSI